MERREFLPLFKTPIILNLLVLLVLQVVIFEGGAAAVVITRDDFPPGFIFGAGSSAYQVEGASAEDGRKPSIWDTFAHAGMDMDKSTGDIAADQYHKYKEDVKLMHDMGLDAYRFSISWSRLVPDGRGNINPEGLQYYNNLIDELVGYGIQPHVTLYHFDLPQALEDEYGGFLSPKVVEDFTVYANICFKEFGDRVKYWITFNEPNFEAIGGYDLGIFPPARCSYPYGVFGMNCSGGDSTKEPYLFAHNVLLSHASAAALYKDKYQVEQGGRVGITILAFWLKPFTNSPEDRVATNRAKDFHIGWFMDPLLYGNYPAIMREIVGTRLPYFDGEESKKLKQSFDFIGVNHYCVFYLQSYPNNLDANHRDYVKDVSVKLSVYADFFTGNFGKLFTTREMPPMAITPWALQELLCYIKVKYGNPPIMIHENGYGEFGLGPTSRNGINDVPRENFLQGYLDGLLQSIRNGSDIRGYFVWSFMDCFELMFGYTARYGLYGVDFKRADRRRFPRLSAQWYSNFLNNGGLRSRASNVVHIE